jgi:hypothetical protein
MFNSVFRKGASRRCGRNVLLAVVFLLSIFCFCNKTSTGPENKCPLFPQKTLQLDVADPMIRIVSPNGGEVFHVSQQCTVKACSKYSLHDAGGGEMRIIIGGKAYTTPDYYPGPINVNSMEGDSAEFAQHGDSVVIANIFKIPDTLYQLDTTATVKISSVSDKCLIELRTYNPPYYPDTTDCYFSIIK